MQRFLSRGVAAIAIAIGFLALSGAAAEAKSLGQQVRGTSWHIVSLTITTPNGGKVEPIGANPIGYVMFDRTGHMITVTSKEGVPNFASGNLQQGTDAEYRAAGQATLVHFGTYKVDEKSHTIITHVVGASFPNWIGTDIDNVAEIKGDQMIWNNSVGPQKLPAVVVWERLH